MPSAAEGTTAPFAKSRIHLSCVGLKMGLIAKIHAKMSKNDLGVDTQWLATFRDPSVGHPIRAVLKFSDFLCFFHHGSSILEPPTAPLSPGRVGEDFLFVLYDNFRCLRLLPL